MNNATMRKLCQKGLKSIDSRGVAYKVSLLGVPEQVNIPIKYCLENGIFNKYGLDVTYSVVPEGTGLMLQKLQNNENDVAITVTDGFIAGKAAGYDIQLVGTYVESPLTWTVASSPKSSFQNLSEFYNGEEVRSIGISRLKSGSHTMSYYMSHLQGADMQKVKFECLGDFANLRKGVIENRADVFLWELFTTKPFFDSGELKQIGNVVTPWPAFSIVASRKGLESKCVNNQSVLKSLFLPALAEGAALFQNKEESVARIVSDFGYEAEDALTWLKSTRYALSNMSVDENVMSQAVDILRQVGLVSQDFKATQLWSSTSDIVNDAITFKPTSGFASSSVPDCFTEREQTSEVQEHAELKNVIFMDAPDFTAEFESKDVAGDGRAQESMPAKVNTIEISKQWHQSLWENTYESDHENENISNAWKKCYP